MANQRNTSGVGRITRSRRVERRKERWALLIASIAIALVIAIPSVGYVINFVLPPREVVIQVNSVEYTLGDIVKLLRVYQKQTEANQGTFNLSVLPFQVVNTLVENELIQQNADSAGISINDEEIESEVRKRILGPIDNDSQATQSELDREFAEKYRRYLNLIQYSQNEHYEMVRLDLYRTVLIEVLSEQIPTNQEHVHLYKMMIANDQEADEARTDYIRGALFEELVQSYDKDPETIRKGGEVGWVPRGIFEDIDELIFDTLEVGELSEPLPELNIQATQEIKLQLFMIADKDPSREVSPSHLNTLKLSSLDEWLSKERAENDVQNNFDSDQYEWIVKQLSLSAKRKQ